MLPTTYQGEPETTIEHVLVMCLIIINGSRRYRGATESKRIEMQS